MEIVRIINGWFLVCLKKYIFSATAKQMAKLPLGPNFSVPSKGTHELIPAFLAFPTCVDQYRMWGSIL